MSSVHFDLFDCNIKFCVVEMFIFDLFNCNVKFYVFYCNAHLSLFDCNVQFYLLYCNVVLFVWLTCNVQFMTARLVFNREAMRKSLTMHWPPLEKRKHWRNSVRILRIASKDQGNKNGVSLTAQYIIICPVCHLNKP